MAQFASMMAGRGVDIHPLPLQDMGRIVSCRLPGGNGTVTSRVLLVLAGLVAIIALPSCAAIPGLGPAPLDTYELTPPSVSSTAPRRSRTQVLVAEPTALRALDGENIVVRTAPASIEYLRGAQWADRLPRMVQARMVDELQATGRLGGVGRPGDGLAIDFQIVSDIRAFEVRVYGQRRATIEMSVRILNDRNGVVRASRVFQVEVPVASPGNDAYVAALDAAHRELASQLVHWVLGAI